MCVGLFFFFKQKTAYEMRISDWSSDVCSSDLGELVALGVKILEILGVEPHPLHRFRRAEADVGLAPVDQVLQLHLHICAALAGLGVLDLDRAPQAFFIFDDVAGTNVHAADLHGMSVSLKRKSRARSEEHTSELQ